MSTVDYHSALSVLVSVKGHPYKRDEFFDMFEAMLDIRYTAVEQPASQVFMDEAHSTPYDALVMYDMPGLDFSTQPPTLVDPSEQLKQDFMALLETGKGVVFLHHAVAGWPTWSEYADVIGARFWYLPSELNGVSYPDGGYRHDTEHRIRVVAEHPVTEGVDSDFLVTDELYLYDFLAEDAIPLLASDFAFESDNFYSATEAVAHGRMYSRDNWQREAGSNLVGWVKHYRNSPIVYLQMGDCPAAYANSNVRRLIENAIRWVSSPAAKAWARQRNQ